MAVSDSSRPIGIFDSGVGGLTVLDTLYGRLPHEDYTYLGDTAHMPYGNRSEESLKALITENLLWLKKIHRIKLLAVACNTAGVYVPILQKEVKELSDIPIIEPIQPTCQKIAKSSWKRVGVLSTPVTAASNQYQKTVARFNPAIEVKSIGCPGLARAIEDGETEPVALLKTFMTPLIEWKMDALVLGCTHYPHILGQVKKLLPEGFPVMDPAIAMAETIEGILRDRHLHNLQKPKGRLIFYVSGSPTSFEMVAQRLPMRKIWIHHTQQKV